MRDVPEAETALDMDAGEVEELQPGAAGLESSPRLRVPVVERFGQAEEVDQPIGGDDDGGDPVAPPPPNVFGGKAAGYSSHVGAVCDAAIEG